MLLILLKSTACLAIFIVFYKLLLEREKMHHFKRYYLLAALVVSFAIPFITFIKYVEPSFDATYIQIDQTAPLNVVPNDTTSNQAPINYLPILLWSIYGLGVLLFGIKFGLNLLRIFSKINKNEKQNHGNFITVLLQDMVSPHTFFSYIFLNKTKFETKAIPQEVLLHEATHARQKHSLDVLFIELLQVLFWFNPLLYFIKKDIKLNHEFLADEAVLKQGTDSSTYQNMLLAFSSHATEPELANAINYSLIKKRFTIMKTKTSRKAIWLRSLLLLPLLGGLLFSFSTTKEVEKEAKPYLKVAESPQVPVVQSERADNSALEETYNIQNGATKKQIKEFNALAKKYNGMSQDAIRVSAKDVERLEYLYRVMSVSQRKNAEPYPVFPPPPPAPKVIKGQASNIPPPPPPAPGVPNYTKVKKGEASNIPPPPAPPKPISTKKQIKDMAAKGADFFYEGAPISSEKAIELVDSSQKNNITFYVNKGKYTVHISKKPITVINGQATTHDSNAKILKEYKLAMAEHKKAREEGKDRIMETTKAQRDAQYAAIAQRKLVLEERHHMMQQNRKPLAEQFVGMEANGGAFFYEGEKISEEKAIALIKDNPKLNVSMSNINGKSTVHLSKKGMKTVNGKLIKQSASAEKSKNPWGIQTAVMEIPKGETHPVKYDNNKELLQDFSKKGATLYFQNEKINLETALSYVDKYKNLHISTSNYNTPNPIVKLYENKDDAYHKN